MVREKRPAEKTATNASKRQKVLTTNIHRSSPTKGSPEHDIRSDAHADLVPEDEERLTQDIQSKLDKLKSEHLRRNKVSKDFEETIKREQTRLSRVIETATEKIERQRNDFRSRMLPILARTLGELSLQQEELPEGLDVFAIKPELNPRALQTATSTLTSCSELIGCYRKAIPIPPITYSTSSIRETFDTDRSETMRAFESAKKMTINQLQAGLADKTDATRDEYDLDDNEYHLARKVLLHGKEKNPARASTNIGPLLYGFGKIMGKMQNMVDG